MDRRSFIGRGLALAGAAAITPVAAPYVRAQGATKITVLVGTAPPDPACHFYYYARENGYYRDAGLDVDIKPIAAETTALRGLIAGEGDVAWVGAISTLQAITSGSRVKVVSVFTPKLDYIVVGQKEVPSLKGFEDRSFAVSQVGAVSQIVPLLMIDQAGGEPKKVQWLAVGGSAARVQALIAKRVQGAALNSAFAARALHYDYLHELGDAIKVIPDFLYAWDVANPSSLQQKKTALDAFVVATARATRWATSNPSPAADISKKILPDQPPAELEAGVADFAKKRFLSPTGEVTPRAWNFTVQAIQKIGILQQAPRYDDVVAKEFAEMVSVKLGPAP